MAPTFGRSERRQARSVLSDGRLADVNCEKGGGVENLRSCPSARTLIHAGTLKSLVREADPSLVADSIVTSPVIDAPDAI
jgi:hypothetical protein